MKNIYKLFLLLLSIFLAVNFSCNTTEPPPPDNGTLTLSLIDVSCSEAWVNLKTNGVTFPVNVNFLADGNTLAQVTNLSSADTTVYIDSLLPNKSYQLQAQFLKDNQTTSSNKITVQTLDTTSNNFTWQTYTFGDGASSVLNDVAIINENNIWAVGEIYVNDSTGKPDPQPYNLAVWNGVSWKLQKVTYQGYPPAIHSILAFSNNNIWLDPWFHWDGVKIQELAIDPALYGFGINKMWGTSSTNLYVVGTSGNIAHYNGSSWQKIESGTTLNIEDIWGEKDNLSGELNILAVASGFRSNIADKKVLAINNMSVSLITTSSLPNALTGIWFAGSHHYYICGDGLYFTNSLSSGWSGGYNGIPSIFEEAIRGNNINDIFVVGDFSLVLHYNGVNWHNYFNDGLPRIDAVLLSVDVKQNTVAFAGQIGNQAAVIIGKR